jgi:hypothetical protein
MLAAHTGGGEVALYRYRYPDQRRVKVRLLDLRAGGKQAKVFASLLARQTGRLNSFEGAPAGLD